MSRRALVYLALIVTSAVASACSSPTAPRREDPSCPDGEFIVVVNSGGFYCEAR